MIKKMTAYIDNCLLNRPFDDQAQERIFVQTQAFLAVLKRIEDGQIEFYNSFAVEYEIDKITSWERKGKIKTFLSLTKERIPFKDGMTDRALKLTKFGFGDMDALHIAAAESAKIDYFVTCDDQLLKIAKRNPHNLKVKVLSVFELLEDIYYASSK